jgi:hypothetical protein
MKPNKSILSAIKAYDHNLDVRWNNQYKHWEIWYKRPTGWKLVTPVTENIYNEGRGVWSKFVPLDHRILEWLASADTARASKKWRWLSKKRYFERIKRRDVRNVSTFANIAKEGYNLINQEGLNPYLSDVTNFKKPEIYGASRHRISYRKKLEIYDRN